MAINDRTPLNQDRLAIRPPLPRDAADLHALASHPAVARTLVQLPTMEYTETLEWMDKLQPGRHRLVADLDGCLVASGSVTQYQNPRLAHGGRLGLMVHPDYWGQGIGTALTLALLDLADNWLNLRRVELDVFTHNSAAIRVYEKAGFAVEGTRRAAAFGDGRWLDEHLMARLRGLDGETAGDPGRVAALATPAGRKAAVSSLRLRTVRPEDADDLHDMWRHPAVDVTTLQMPSLEYSRTAERARTRQPGMYRYAADVDGKVVGIISLHVSQNPRLAHSGGLGMMVHPDYWGLGVGSRLMEALLDLADNWLNLKRVDLDVNTDNPAGVRLYEKFGFVVEGTKRFHAYGGGRWANSHFMARIKE